MPDTRFVSARFPRSSRYHPDWVIASVGGGANSLWLTEWLAEALDLRPGMRVLDLGCGHGASSVFLRREFGVEVWAVDLWQSATHRGRRFRDAGVGDGAFAIHADSHELPFAGEFFDTIVSIDSFFYYGTDDTYLSYITHFLKPGGTIAIAGAGMTQEIDGELPEHLRAWWDPSCWSLHSAAWWRRHWEKTGLVTVDLADSMPDGWQRWLDWHRVVAPDNAVEIAALEADQGRYMGYARVVARRRPDAKIDEPFSALPSTYSPAPLLRDV